MGNCKLCGKESGNFTVCDECRTNLYREKVSPKNTCKICGKPTDNPKLCDDCLADVLQEHSVGKNEIRTVESDLIIPNSNNASEADYTIIHDNIEKPQQPVVNATYIKPNEPLHQTININIPVTPQPQQAVRNDDGRRHCIYCGNPNFRPQYITVRKFRPIRFIVFLFLTVICFPIGGMLISSYESNSVDFFAGVATLIVGIIFFICALSAFWGKKQEKHLTCTNCGHIQD